MNVQEFRKRQMVNAGEVFLASGRRQKAAAAAC